MRVALIVWVALIGALTLHPVESSGEIIDALCLVCGVRGTADLLLNVALFVPFGYLMGRQWGWRYAVLWGLVLTIGVESLQLEIPGRSPALGDLVANMTGALLGAGVAGHESTGAAVLAVLAVLVALSPAVFFEPDPPDGIYYGQWTARFGNMAAYEGRVVSATIGAIDVPSRRSPRSEEIRRVLSRDGPIDVRFEAGGPTPELAPVFSVFDGMRREIFLMGVDGTDIVVRRWLRARSFRLDTPEMRWTDALAGVRKDESVRVRIEPGSRALCVTVNDRTRCDLLPKQGAGWTLLYGPSGLSPLLTDVLSSAFVLGLGFLIAIPGWSTPTRLASLGGSVLVGFFLSSALSYVAASLVQGGAMVFGGAMGFAFRRFQVR